jgi:hypothetical protein
MSPDIVKRILMAIPTTIGALAFICFPFPYTLASRLRRAQGC